MPAAVIDDDAPEVIDLNAPAVVDPNAVVEEDDGSTPDTPAQEAARATALRAVAAETPPGEEVVDEDAAAAAAAGKPMPKMIPTSRFMEVNDRVKELTEQNRLLLETLAANKTPAAAAPAVAATPAAPAFDVKQAMKDQLAALATGDDDKALELAEAINAHTLSEARRLAREDMAASNAEVSEAQAARELKAAGDDIKIAYPELDNKGTAPNTDAILFVISKRDSLVAAGKPAHNALREAAEVAAKLFGFAGAKPADPAVKVDARAVAARARNAAALNAQPPALGGNGERSTAAPRLKVEEMTDAQLKALPESELAKLDGSA